MSRVRDRPPYKLSAGEKRAVAIATVLALEPDVLVLDEPSSHLDPRGRRRLIDLLNGFGHTRVMVTHDLELALEVCSRAIVLDGGRVVADGPIRDVLNDEPLMLAHGLERPHSLRHHHPH
jgi:cobalt/nickel transport system ATP-binding protein